MLQKTLPLMTIIIITQCLPIFCRIPLPKKRHPLNGALIIGLIDYCLPQSRTIGLIGDTTEVTESPLFGRSTKSYLTLPIPEENESEKHQLSKVIAYDVDAYVVMTPPAQIASTLQNLVQQPWWQKDKLVIMAESGLSEYYNSCNRSMSFMADAAYFRLANAVFVCITPKYAPVLCSYTESTQYPGKQWYYAESRMYPNSRRLYSIIWRYYGHSQQICQSLISRRIKNSKRTKINAVAATSYPYVWLLDEKGRFTPSGVDTQLFALMVKYFKASGVIQNVNETQTIDVTSLNVLQKITDSLRSEYDMMINSLLCQNSPQFDHTYPHFWTQVSVVTKLKDNKSTLERIFDFMPPYIMMILIGTGIFTCLMLRYIFHDGFENIMDTLALLLSISVGGLPIKTPGRLFFSPILILFLVTNSVFQGNLSNLLTVPVQQRNVEKIEDLNELGYTVRGSAHIESYLNDVFHGNFTSVQSLHYSCAELQDNEAYMDDVFRLELTSEYEKCHIPKVPFFVSYRCFYVAKNWPLLPEVNRFLQIAFEAGFVNNIRRHYEKLYNKDQNRWWLEVADYRRPLKLQDLHFAFILLAIGLTLSLIVFVIEILWARRRRRLVQAELRLWAERRRRAQNLQLSRQVN